MTSTESAQTHEDPHIWLEDVLGEKQLDWVRERNQHAVETLGDPAQTALYRRILDIMNSKDKIPMVRKIGNDGQYYNFWRDEKHVQGIWRRTTLESYRTAEPDWVTVIDVDALPPPTTGTATKWVWHGADLLDEGAESPWDRALISLSPGGSDADTVREFDLKEEKFIEPDAGGFALPNPAKASVGYRSRNEVLIGTDFLGDGSTLTTSGYPRVVKSWIRGTPLSEAKVVFEGELEDVSCSQYSYYDRGFKHEFQRRSITFYTSKRWYRSPKSFEVRATDESESFTYIDVPDDVQSFSTFADAATIRLRSPWTPPGHSAEFPAGSLLSAPMADVVRGDWSKLVALFTPTATASLTSTTGTKDFLIIKILQDVLPVLKFWRYSAGVWQEVTSQDAQSGVPVGQDVCISAISPDDSNDVWLQRDGYLVPDNLELGTAEDNCSTTSVLKTKPAMFDASSLTVDQHFAVSNDGTRIPYFVQRRSDLKLDGSNATLLDAYGGFEISRLPYYSAVHGSSWLERGGVRVVANIRGGGEYGPMWHQSALKENRQRCYEDMESVAADLIARGITCQNKLACIGGSNGGLLIGNMITRERACSLFGAAVCQVPLLDMKRYSKLLAGASWMAEYGDPDTDDWKFIRGFSSYQVLRHDCLGLPEEGQPRTPNTQWRCPKVLFTTSTRDDRVHPGHARKMVKALVDEATREQAPTVLYWENIEGGHGGAADNTQAAYMWALTYEFVSQSLGLGSPDQSAL